MDEKDATEKPNGSEDTPSTAISENDKSVEQTLSESEFSETEPKTEILNNIDHDTGANCESEINQSDSVGQDDVNSSSKINPSAGDSEAGK